PVLLVCSVALLYLHSFPTRRSSDLVLSLIGIFAGAIVLFGMFSSKRLNGWIALFLASTVLTSVTGFFFPRDHLLPSHIVGIISLDRKSTRLNSSHVAISYAVFCLKK